MSRRSLFFEETEDYIFYREQAVFLIFVSFFRRNFYLCSPFAGWAGDSVASLLSPLGGGPRGVRSGATPTSQTSTRPGPVVRSRGPAVAAQLLVPLASVSCDLSDTKAEPARDLGFAPQSVQADRVLGGLWVHTQWDPLCVRGKAGWALNWPRVTAGRHPWVLLKPHSPGLLWAQHASLSARWDSVPHTAGVSLRGVDLPPSEWRGLA